MFTDQPLTAAPEGYEPFYLTHYGRHGSRWLIADDSYTSVTGPLQKAQGDGKLTQKGEELLATLKPFVAGTTNRLGDLTTVGERQHHGIARRMVRNFPEIFRSPNVAIDARSTVVIRCILSMTAECEELAAANPSARFHNDVSEAFQYYLNGRPANVLQSMGRKGRDIRKKSNGRVSADRITKVLFNDQQWVKDSVDAWDFMYNLFEVTANMQSHDTDIDLYPLFTDDEIYEHWRMRNIGWYIDYAASPMTESLMPFRQNKLLRNFIETADTITQTQATLRFGHESCLMPLACLMELDDCAIAVNDTNRLEEVWRNYRIFPMASNIQMVFYRKKDSADSHALGTRSQDVLVKVLLNERECRLPIKSDRHPYYRWADLRQYYVDKLNAFDYREQKFNEEAKKKKKSKLFGKIFH
jgi:hypothetical protein